MNYICNICFQAGYLISIVMLILGYSVVVLTVLSISAIATSANVETGGVYCILTTELYVCIYASGSVKFGSQSVI